MNLFIVCVLFKAVYITKAVDVVIFVPPEAPTTILTLLCLSQMMVGHMEESGLLPAHGCSQMTVQLYNLKQALIFRLNKQSD